MTKLNRNDRCPCGSGEKFKKCCIDVPEHLRNWPDDKDSEHNNVPVFLSDHNSNDLLKSFAALSILPQNHGKNLRLELAAISALQAFNTLSTTAPKSKLKSFMDDHYSSHYLEDPQANLFTDLVSYHGGDYLIFPGITETGSFIITNLLTAINHWPDADLPKQFKSNCHHGIMFILGLSNVIATSMGYQRYQIGEPKQEPIEFPPDGVFDHSRNAVEFSKAQMTAFLQERGISERVVQMFTLDRNQIDFRNFSIEDSPVAERPILETTSGFLVISPTALSLALTNFIWGQASDFKCTKELEDAYNDVVWNNVQMRLKLMDFELITSKEVEPLLSRWENLYRFDTDKIALIRLIAPSRVAGANEKRMSAKELLAKVKEIQAFKDEQYLELSLISDTGNMVMHSISYNAHARVLPIELYEFDVLGNLGDTDAIDLWNFAIAVEEQTAKGTMNLFSFLDVFKLYNEKDDSFYISDDSKNNVIHVQPGYSAEYIFKSKLKKDAHSINIKEDGQLFRVPVIRKDRYLPIYCDPNDLANNVLRFAVEGFHQSVWVTPDFDLSKVHGEFRNTLFQLNDTVAFWLSQVRDEIKQSLKALGEDPISIRFDLELIEKFQSIEHDFNRDPNLFDKFKWSVSGSEVVLQIPGELMPYFYGADNEGERVLVKSLLHAISALLVARGLSAITDDRINEILDKCAPLGTKKKFLLLDSSDNLLLDKRNLIEERRIREYNVNVVLNSIVPGLGNKAPAVGEITAKADKEKLTRNIVMYSLLPSLKKAIAKYDCEELLVRLIELNEASIQQREFYNVNTPSRIACYVSVEQHGIDWLKSSSEINRTTLALRCLMEHVAAEQHRGTTKLSTTGIDELIAIMDQVIAWASIADQINYDLFDTSMAILASGRVGTGKGHQKEILEPFHETKINEDIQDSIDSYDNVYAQRSPVRGGDVPKFLDKAFKDEYNITFTRLCELMGALSLVAFQLSTSFAKIRMNSLLAEVNKFDKQFSEEEFKIGMDFLTLVKRKKVEDIPPGFDSIDISPWRFNRRLSLLRRPFMVIENSQDSNNPWVYWGPRQVLRTRSYMAEQLQSGRFRVAEGGSVDKALGRIAGNKGDLLVQKILKSIKSEDIKVHTSVWIGPNEVLYDPKDLGDVDVLIIHKGKKILYSLECKNMEPSRNIKEMVEELSKMMGSSSERGLIEKHVERDTWLKSNKALLGKKFGLDLSDYEVKSIFLTSEGMLTPVLKKQNLPLPFVTRYELNKFGLAALDEAANAQLATSQKSSSYIV